MEKVGTIISTVLYALAVAIGILGAIFYYLEMEFFATEKEYWELSFIIWKWNFLQQKQHC